MNDTNSINAPYLVHHFLENSADRYPEKVALIHENVRATYAAINTQSNRLARFLMSRGINKGDRVVLIFENGLEYAAAYYGILKLGAVVAALSTDLKPHGIEPLLAQLEAKAIILSSRFEKLLNASDLDLIQRSALIIKNGRLNWSAKNVVAYSWDEIANASDSPNPGVSMDPSELAAIIYTSGSTGTPKGVMLSHRNIVANTDSICQSLQITAADIQMVVLPFFYVMGKSLFNTHFAAGATVVVNNKFAYPATVIQQMVDEKVTAFSGVPSTYAYLLHRSPLEKQRGGLQTLRYCSQAGGHMSATLKQKLRRALPGHTRIYIMYGATEASARLTVLKPDHFEDKMDSIGKPIPGVALAIMDEKGRQLPDGEKGELVASGPNIMQGYWRDAVATAGALDKTGYHTGDMGHKDEEGFFYVEGRRDNLIKVGGHRINPREIEDALLATDLVVEAAAVGLPDDLLGNRLVALIVPQNGDCTVTRVFESCSKKLPKYKMPAEIKMVRLIPKNAAGKTDHAKCIELVSGCPT